MKKAVLVMALCLLASAAFIFSQISKMGSVSFATVVESKNPTGMVAAHLMGKTGATDGTVHKVVIYPIGQSSEKAPTVFLADEVDELAVLWISAEELRICFGQARIFQFTNFYSTPLDNDEYHGRIVIHQDLQYCK